MCARAAHLVLTGYPTAHSVSVCVYLRTYTTSMVRAMCYLLTNLKLERVLTAVRPYGTLRLYDRTNQAAKSFQHSTAI